MLDLAARAAFRGTGHVEPNPLVGCVLVRPGTEPVWERVLAIGHHRRFGGPHAEIDALARCAALGRSPAGATVYATLEPCNSHGRNPPCAAALVDARVGRVVCAARDESPGKGGGADTLAAAGIPCDFTSVSQRAIDLSEPWRHRLKTPLPWVVAKWAQTSDGLLARPQSGERWISNERSRVRVHRIRAAVDAVMVGAGTVAIDDPQLTVRGVPARRRPARVVVSRGASLAADRRLILTARDDRTIVLCDAPPGADGALELERAGVVLAREPGSAEPGWLRRGLVRLRADYGISTLMVEGGGKLLASLLADGLINEVHVHGGAVAGGEHAGVTAPSMSDASVWRVVSIRRVGSDVQTVFRRR